MLSCTSTALHPCRGMFVLGMMIIIHTKERAPIMPMLINSFIRKKCLLLFVCHLSFTIIESKRNKLKTSLWTLGNFNEHISVFFEFLNNSLIKIFVSWSPNWVTDLLGTLKTTFSEHTGTFLHVCAMFCVCAWSSPRGNVLSV